MSHFSVLVIGDNIESQLAPYNEQTEDPRFMEFEETEDKYREEYENDTRGEFYSGNGYHLYEDEFNQLSEKEIGQTITINVRSTGLEYLNLYDKKRAEYRSDTGDYEGRDKEIWYEVIDVLETTHPNRDVVFDGKVRIKRIDPPKEIPLKEYYDSFEDFMKDWAGYSETDKRNGKYGHWHNPNAKWDWYQIGGRYRDQLKLKEGADGEKGKRQEQFVGSLYRESKPGWCDSALKGDVDWNEIHQNQKDYDHAIRFWELKIEGATPENEDEEEQLKYDWYKPEFYTERYGDKETFAKCRSNFTVWAIVKDGEWIEKGEMGWFGMSCEGNDEALEWEMNMYDKFIKDLPDDTPLTIVDCHI